MRNLDAEAYGCMWLLSSVIASILVPVALSEAGVESRLAWYILAPGWRLSPFGHAEVWAPPTAGTPLVKLRHGAAAAGDAWH
jgi:hypothetical protein